jgi:cytochrome c oxidase subunit I
MLFTLKVVTLPHVQAVYGRPADGAEVTWEHAVSTSEQTVRVIQAPRTGRKGSILAYWLSSTDHKVIGHMYLITSFFFFLCAGIMALLMRIQLMGPDQRVMSDQQYNALFTMHGTLMLLLFATPLFIGFANELLPLQIGAPDVAFPRLNILSYYLFTFGGLILLASFLTPGGAAAFGWYAYSPLTSATYSPGVGGDLWVMGLVLSGVGTILSGVNFITTVFCMRAPGMTMFRMPMFTWNALLTSTMVLLAFPVLAAALLVLEADRRLGSHVFDAASGGAILWQHLFWFFGHPEVYILALPFFGIATEIIPVFSRKPLFGYKGMIAATIAIAGLSMTVWAHHMFTTGAVLLPFFSFMTLLIAVPTGVKFFNWAGTMWRGQLTFEPPMLYAIGFLVTFLFGGITGIILASPPLDFAVSDSYFVVAHFHYVLAGTVLFAMFAGFYFWWPKMTGKMLNSRIGKIQFWIMFTGFHMTFLVQHWMGVEGMPRRIANYPDLAGNVTTLNVISTVGSWILALSILVFFWNIYVTWRYGEKVTEEDPWGYCSSLEWATSCPPPRHNFYRIPRIRSERPAFEAHYPHIKAGRASRGLEQEIPAISNMRK